MSCVLPLQSLLFPYFFFFFNAVKISCYQQHNINFYFGRIQGCKSKKVKIYWKCSKKEKFLFFYTAQNFLISRHFQEISCKNASLRIGLIPSHWAYLYIIQATWHTNHTGVTGKLFKTKTVDRKGFVMEITYNTFIIIHYKSIIVGIPSIVFIQLNVMFLNKPCTKRIVKDKGVICDTKHHPSAK